MPVVSGASGHERAPSKGHYERAPSSNHVDGLTSDKLSCFIETISDFKCYFMILGDEVRPRD